MKNYYNLKLKPSVLYLLISIYLNTGIKFTVNFVIQPHCQCFIILSKSLSKGEGSSLAHPTSKHHACIRQSVDNFTK